MWPGGCALVLQTLAAGFKLDPLSNRVKESELRAFYLLRQQHLSLLSLWNGTLVNPSLNQSENVLGSFVLFEDVKSAVSKQISLNKEIQEVSDDAKERDL
ncbi:hypothetical protein ARALYDRAFT_890615 [Arabidopsis lyrata subsp. lyrata]|uniref:Uncharacterized protein n=1 Tax=Arabidopsis lyrata subsp. lyrata TaxID=81972 RepID=D7KFM2_ARALL|nr:hypothetical protein ARALYDRAFT_890615 [Arabidopsis lyrata subsp. lyrata]